MESPYERTALLLGQSALEKLQNSLITVVGLGGVGGHCTEALARAGVGRLHLVDFDTVNLSNLNRQLVATKLTVGQKKTEAMAARVREVSDCRVTCYDGFVTAQTVAEAVPEDSDFLVDAIDSAAGKLALACYARDHGIPMVSCMGAGNRLDPTAFHVIDIYRTQNDPLARKMRHELRKAGIESLPVVCSTELSHARPGQTVIGSFAPVTAAAGLTAAGYSLRFLVESFLPKDAPSGDAPAKKT